MTCLTTHNQSQTASLFILLKIHVPSLKLSHAIFHVKETTLRIDSTEMTATLIKVCFINWLKYTAAFLLVFFNFYLALFFISVLVLF